MDESWEIIYSAGQLYKAELIVEVLQENNIEAIIINKQDSLYLFGDIEIYVKPHDVIKAKHIIKDYTV